MMGDAFRIAFVASIAVGFGLLSGCVSVPKDAGFNDVQKEVAERGGLPVQWRGHTADDAAVDLAVHSLLEKDLTADDAAQIALLNNLNLQATFEELGISQSDLVQAGLLPNPTLYVERRFYGQATEIDVAQSLLDVLVIPLRKRIASADFEATKRRVGQAIIDLAADTRGAFYTLQGAQQMVEMRQTVVSASNDAVDTAKRLHDAGNTTDLDLANEEQLASQGKLDLAMAEMEVTQDRERLNVLMGLWGTDTQWHLSSRLPELPPTEVAGGGLESQAIEQRLELQGARQQIEAAAQTLGLSQYIRYVPDLTISGHYEHEIEPLHSVGPAVQLTVPIFDQGQASVAKGRALLAQAQLRYTAQAIEVRSAVRASYSRMLAARERAEYYRREVLPLQQRILEQSQLQYNGMFLGPIQLIQVKQAQINAAREYIETLSDYWLQRTELERAVGGKLKGAAASTAPAEPLGPPQPNPPMDKMKGMSGMKDMPGM